METLKYRLFTNWNFMRWLRLALGLYVGFQAYQFQDVAMGLLSGVFLFQALGNFGCCGSSGCAVTPKRNEFEKADGIRFEEIKQE